MSEKFLTGDNNGNLYVWKLEDSRVFKEYSVKALSKSCRSGTITHIWRNPHSEDEFVCTGFKHSDGYSNKYGSGVFRTSEGSIRLKRLITAREGGGIVSSSISEHFYAQTQSRNVTIVDLTGYSKEELPVIAKTQFSFSINCVSLLPSSQLKGFLVSGDQGKLEMWNFKKKKRKKARKGDAHSPLHQRWNYNNKVNYGNCRLVSAFSGHKFFVNDLKWISQNQFASASDDCTVRIWDLVKQKQISQVSPEGMSWIWRLEYHKRRGVLFASGGKSQVMMLSTRSKRCIRTFHDSESNSPNNSIDGVLIAKNSQIVTVGGGSRCHLWNINYDRKWIRKYEHDKILSEQPQVRAGLSLDFSRSFGTSMNVVGETEKRIGLILDGNTNEDFYGEEDEGEEDRDKNNVPEELLQITFKSDLPTPESLNLIKTFIVAQSKIKEIHTLQTVEFEKEVVGSEEQLDISRLDERSLNYLLLGDEDDEDVVSQVFSPMNVYDYHLFFSDKFLKCQIHSTLILDRMEEDMSPKDFFTTLQVLIDRYYVSFNNENENDILQKMVNKIPFFKFLVLFLVDNHQYLLEDDDDEENVFSQEKDEPTSTTDTPTTPKISYGRRIKNLFLERFGVKDVQKLDQRIMKKKKKNNNYRNNRNNNIYSFFSIVEVSSTLLFNEFIKPNFLSFRHQENKKSTPYFHNFIVSGRRGRIEEEEKEEMYSFRVHREVLTLGSNFFFQCFNFPGSESRGKKFVLGHMFTSNIEIFYLLKFIYTQSLSSFHEFLEEIHRNNNNSIVEIVREYFCVLLKLLIQSEMYFQNNLRSMVKSEIKKFVKTKVTFFKKRKRNERSCGNILKITQEDFREKVLERLMEEDEDIKGFLPNHLKKEIIDYVQYRNEKFVQKK